MSFLTIISIAVFIGYAVVSRFNIISKKQPDSSPQVMSDIDVVESTSSPSATAQPKVTTPPKTSSEARININVDSNLGNTTPSSEKLVYPGAADIGGNRYETNTDGDTVYNWYKSELEKRSYNIRNNVRTKANDKFKAVLQGVAAESSLKVTIDQENASAKTVILVE